MDEPPPGAAALGRLAEAAFEPASRGLIGAELEWITYRRDDPHAALTAAEVAAAIGPSPLPGGSRLSVEPGGQMELSTRPEATLDRLLDHIDMDVTALQDRLDGTGLGLAAVGVDPLRKSRPTLRSPRYVAMAAFFARHSPSGLEMMASTAALQLNIDFGPDPGRTMAHATAVAPVLGALFANSPLRRGRPATTASHRLGIWAETDPSRTAPLADPSPAGWARYALDARLMIVDHEGLRAGPPGGPPLQDWLARQAPDAPDRSDLGRLEATLRAHISTLFPPVRPRGYLELRVLDALPRPDRRAALALTWALLSEDGAGAAAARACAGEPLRIAALRRGLVDPTVAEAAAECVTVAVDRLGRSHPALAGECWGVAERRLSAACAHPVAAAGSAEQLVEAALRDPA